MFTDFLKIGESNPFGVRSHFLQDLSYATHLFIVALLILLVKFREAHNASHQRLRQAQLAEVRLHAIVSLIRTQKTPHQV